MEETKKNKTVSFGAVNITPDTIRNTPDVVASEAGNWINFGLQNDLHYYLADSVQHSPTHSAIIDFKATTIQGNGLELSDIDTDVLSTNQIKKAAAKAATDLPVFETFTWLLTTNPYGDIIKIKPLPNEAVRVSDLDETTGEPFKYFFSYNWNKNLDIKEYPAFNMDVKKAGSFIMQRRIIRPNQYFYTVPAYYSAHEWISLEDKIANFHKTNIDSGFFPMVMMEFFGDEPTETEKVILENKIAAKFQGTQGKKLFTIFTAEGEDATKITSFNPPDLPNYFEKLMSEISAKIMTAHRIPAILVGIKEVGKTGLGSNSEEIQASYQLYESTSIAPYRNLITEAINDILLYNGIESDIKYKSYQPSFGDIKTTIGKRTDLEQ